MDVLYCLAPQKMVTEKNIRYKARRYNMSKKASETPEVPSYIPPASEKEKIIEKIRKKGIECKPDGTGIPIFYTNDPKVMDMIRKEINERSVSYTHLTLPTT